MVNLCLRSFSLSNLVIWNIISVVKSKNPVISIFTSNWGHGGIAQAAKRALKRLKYIIYFNHIPASKFSAQTYVLGYQLFPSLHRIPFIVTGNKSVQKLLSSYLSKKYINKVEKHLRDQKPDIVINTYFAFNSIIENFSRKKSFLLINIVADPWTFHQLSVSKEAYNFVFDKKSFETCKKEGLESNKCIKSGWFVREKFSENYNQGIVRKNLRFEPDILNFCIIGGSEGAYSILKVVPALIDVKKPVQIVFICGNNKHLLKSVGILKKIFSSAKSRVTIIPIGFTDRIDEYIKASDLVIGKAGPNLLFETVATHTPFFAISHIAGQEDGNLDIIKKYKLGFVEEKPIKAALLIRKIINNPKILNGFENNLIKMAEYNKNSYKILQKFIEDKRQRLR